MWQVFPMAWQCSERSPLFGFFSSVSFLVFFSSNYYITDYITDGFPTNRPRLPIMMLFAIGGNKLEFYPVVKLHSVARSE
jgi:hypothetical protein